MSLYLVQHGKSLAAEVDPAQGLSQDGIVETKRIAETALSYKVPIDRIEHSGKKRAEQTAQIFCDILCPQQLPQRVSGLKPMDDAIAKAAALDAATNLMLVGHLPFMSRLTSYLITAKIEPPLFAFQNSGVVCLEPSQGTETGRWLIKWSLMPHIG
jgi:phosphohistidine phosphatase